MPLHDHSSSLFSLKSMIATFGIPNIWKIPQCCCPLGVLHAGISLSSQNTRNNLTPRGSWQLFHSRLFSWPRENIFLLLFFRTKIVTVHRLTFATEKLSKEWERDENAFAWAVDIPSKWIPWLLKKSTQPCGLPESGKDWKSLGNNHLSAINIY